MTTQSSSQPISQPRRKDRAIDDEQWIQDFLRRAPWGVIATEQDGQPFINTNLFAYDAERRAVYFHTFREGRTRLNIEANSRVCFSISEMGRLLPADTALEFSVEYAGVTVFGRASVVADEAEARHGLHLLLDKYFPHLRPERDYRGIHPDELKRTAVYRLDIDQWSGKRKAVGEFPGAFLYGEHNMDEANPLGGK